MSIETPTSISEKVTQLLDDLRDSRPNHWSRWLQIAGGREALEASLLAQVEAQSLSAGDIYIHWFNTNMETLPYLTNREGIMRGRIEEDIRDIMVDYGFEIRDGQFVDKYDGDASADTEVRDAFLAWTQGLSFPALVELFLEKAKEKEGSEDPHEVYITGVGEPLAVLNEEDVERRVDEIDRELGEPDPQVLAWVRSMSEESRGRRTLGEKLTDGAYGSHNICQALARVFEIDVEQIRREVPDLTREDCNFVCRPAVNGNSDVIEVTVYTGVASNRYAEKVLRVSKLSGTKVSKILVLPVEQENLPEA